MGRNDLFYVLLFILGIICADVIALYPTEYCDKAESTSTVLNLKRHLLCEYDTDTRPVQNNKNVTRVWLQLIPQFVQYTHETQIFDLHSWTTLEWEDSHLTWDPAQFDNIQMIFASIYEIWIPDITLHNEFMQDQESNSAQSRCSIERKGTVRWIVPVKHSTYCNPDDMWWPYSTLNCTIQFGSWSYSSDEIVFDVHKSQSMKSLMDLREHVEWDLLEVQITKQTEKHKYNLDSTTNLISYHFIMKRRWGIVRIVYVTPTIVLMVMTLTALWLEPKSFEQMIIANLNFICHILCIQDMHWEMPKDGLNTPKLLAFYESSFAIASFTLILTSILRHLQELSTEPPVWISTVTTSILRSRAGQILLVSILDPAATAKIEADADDNADLVQSNSKKSPWRHVTMLIGWLAFLSMSLAYIILLSTCFPMYFPQIPSMNS